jgi:hypothetical protein
MILKPCITTTSVYHLYLTTGSIELDQHNSNASYRIETQSGQSYQLTNTTKGKYIITEPSMIISKYGLIVLFEEYCSSCLLSTPGQVQIDLCSGEIELWSRSDPRHFPYTYEIQSDQLSRGIDGVTQAELYQDIYREEREGEGVRKCDIISDSRNRLRFMSHLKIINHDNIIDSIDQYGSFVYQDQTKGIVEAKNIKVLYNGDIYPVFSRGRVYANEKREIYSVSRLFDSDYYANVLRKEGSKVPFIYFYIDYKRNHILFLLLPVFTLDLI